MTTPHFVLLYVSSPAESAAFYTRLLGCAPVEQSPTFAMFVLDSGMRLGLWTRQEVKPAASMMGGGAELVIALPSDAAVDEWHERWAAQGLHVLQPPVRLDFGYTFVAADPDAHRLRVYCATEG